MNNLETFLAVFQATLVVLFIYNLIKVVSLIIKNK